MKRILISILFLFATSALAQLTVRVTPGHTFREGERPTTSTLNQLGKPTIAVYGTIGGTNVSLGTNSVLGDHLSDSVVDNFTIEFNNDVSPRHIRVKAFNIGTNVISTNIAGIALAGGGGEPLRVLIDTNIFDITAANEITLRTNLDLSLLSLNLTNNYIFLGDTNNHAIQVPLATAVSNLLGGLGWTSVEYTLPGSAGVVANTNHGFAATPSSVRWVLVCKTTDQGYAVGDELDVSLLDDMNGVTCFQQGANETNTFLIFNTGAQVLNKSSGAHASITASRWKAKGYARP